MRNRDVNWKEVEKRGVHGRDPPLDLEVYPDSQAGPRLPEMGVGPRLGGLG